MIRSLMLSVALVGASAVPMRCDPPSRSCGDYAHLRAALGEWVDRWTLMDPVQNVRAAAVLFDYWSDAGRSGYRPWSL